MIATKFEARATGTITPPPDDGAQFIVKVAGYKEANRYLTKEEALDRVAELMEQGAKINIIISVL